MEMPACCRRTGSIRIAADEAELEDCKNQFDAMRSDQLPVEWYKGLEGEGLLFPTDGVMNPLYRARLLAKKVMDKGAVLFSKTQAINIQSNYVKTNGGVINCRRVIVAIDGRLE